MNETRRLRRPAEGGYARGDETRRRIIEAAIELFGEKGFTAASTREIAALAGVNAPALQYYFENKEGVFRACAESMADDVWTTFAPVVESAQATLETHDDVDALVDAFIAIQDALAERMLHAPKTSSQKLFFMREQSGHEPQIGSEILEARVRRPLNQVSARLVAKISGSAPDDPVTLIRMVSLYGQLMLFHIAPRSALSILGWSEIDAEKEVLLRSTVREQTRALLRMWHSEGAALAASPDGGAAPRRRTSTRRTG
ncbi:CerR family C-terminal domain-containing protein [Paraburkholderia phosphatilytica]|uniref:CerR family C-terminal domain-containing protein n=1 Tax=Paraburkholderia phosphatilytica TaxID=2282883 RepID=UPI000E468028|nr:CerR family C-terminal domain-containing protein [Paraburkholderia phosphatilytica]